MILRLFNLIKRWAFLFVLGISFTFTSCLRGKREDILVSDDLFISKLDKIFEDITKKRPVFDNNGKIIGKEFCKENLSKVLKSFQDVEENLKSLPFRTGYAIPQSTLREMHARLSGLEEGINNLEDGRYKIQIKKAWHQLNELVASLITPKKNVPQSAPTHPSPAG